jgi:hypothetical protein
VKRFQILWRYGYIRIITYHITAAYQIRQPL